MIRDATPGMTLVMIRASSRTRILVVTRGLSIRVYPMRAVRLLRVRIRSLVTRVTIARLARLRVMNLSVASQLQP